MLVFGKKTQVCGIAVTRRVDEVDSVFAVSSRINSTWGGNLVDMVRCERFIEVIESEGLLEQASRVGDEIRFEGSALRSRRSLRRRPPLGTDSRPT